MVYCAESLTCLCDVKFSSNDGMMCKSQKTFGAFYVGFFPKIELSEDKDKSGHLPFAVLYIDVKKLCESHFQNRSR